MRKIAQCLLCMGLKLANFSCNLPKIGVFCGKRPKNDFFRMDLGGAVRDKKILGFLGLRALILTPIFPLGPSWWEGEGREPP